MADAFDLNFTNYSAGTLLSAIAPEMTFPNGGASEFKITSDGAALDMRSLAGGSVRPLACVNLGSPIRYGSAMVSNGAGVMLIGASPSTFLVITKSDARLDVTGLLNGSDDLPAGNTWKRFSNQLSVDPVLDADFIEWFIDDDGFLVLYRNNKRASWLAGDNKTNTWQLPPEVRNGTYAGFYRASSSSSLSNRCFRARAGDGVNRVVFQKTYTKRIGTTDTSAMYVKATHNVAGATSATLHVEDIHGNHVTEPVEIARSGDTVEGTSSVIPSASENSYLFAVVTITGVSGVGVGRNYALVPPTLPYQPSKLYQNYHDHDYFTRFGPDRDLSKVMHWRTNSLANVLRPWMEAYPQSLSGVSSSYCDLDNEGHPHKQPAGTGQLYASTPYWIAPSFLGDTMVRFYNKVTGDTITDSAFTLVFPNNAAATAGTTVTLNFYGKRPVFPALRVR